MEATRKYLALVSINTAKGTTTNPEARDQSYTATFLEKKIGKRQIKGEEKEGRKVTKSNAYKPSRIGKNSWPLFFVRASNADCLALISYPE